MAYQGSKFWKALALSAVMPGCAHGAAEETAPNTDCKPAPEAECRQRVWPGIVSEWSIVYLDENKNSVITAYDFLPEEQRVTLSYITKDKNNTFKTRAGETYLVEHGSLYVGEINFQDTSEYVFLVLAEKEVKTQTANLLSGEEGTLEEVVALNSNCRERKYRVSATRGTGLYISSPEEEVYVTPSSSFAKPKNLLFFEYDRGRDGCLVHKLEDSGEYIHTVVHFFEDAVECK